MKSISPVEVKRIAALSALDVSADELPQMAAELGAILSHMDALQAVVSGETLIGARSHEDVAELSTPLREDTERSGITAVNIKQIAPATADGFFLVPRLDTHGAADPESHA